MKNKKSIHQIRTIAFIFALIFYLASYLLYPRGSYPGRISFFLELLGTLSLFFSFIYKKKDEQLKIHRFIEEKITGDSRRVYSWLAGLMTIPSLIGAYYFYRSIYLGTHENSFHRAAIKLFAIFLMLTYSFWERRNQLKN